MSRWWTESDTQPARFHDAKVPRYLLKMTESLEAVSTTLSPR